MNGIRESIKNRTFVDFVKNFMIEAFPDKKYPKWVIDALQAVSIQLDVDEAAKFVVRNLTFCMEYIRLINYVRICSF